MAEKVEEVLVVCWDCEGTGLFVGRGESDHVAVVCRTCKGLGCIHHVHRYEVFEGRGTRPHILRVFQANPGILLRGEPSNGGMQYPEWLKGQAFAPGMEDRTVTCPAWWYQAADSAKKPQWERCYHSASFAHCGHFAADRAKCWELWDAEFGVAAGTEGAEQKGGGG